MQGLESELHDSQGELALPVFPAKAGTHRTIGTGFRGCQEIRRTDKFVAPAKAGAQRQVTEIPRFLLSRGISMGRERFDQEEPEPSTAITAEAAVAPTGAAVAGAAPGIAPRTGVRSQPRV